MEFRVGGDFPTPQSLCKSKCILPAKTVLQNKTNNNTVLTGVPSLPASSVTLSSRAPEVDEVWDTLTESKHVTVAITLELVAHIFNCCDVTMRKQSSWANNGK